MKSVMLGLSLALLSSPLYAEGTGLIDQKQWKVFKEVDPFTDQERVQGVIFDESGMLVSLSCERDEDIQLSVSTLKKNEGLLVSKNRMRVDKNSPFKVSVRALNRYHFAYVSDEWLERLKLGISAILEVKFKRGESGVVRFGLKNFEDVYNEVSTSCK
ncbi:hypothetical protein AB3Y13_22900 [Vibrio alginolyticus]